MEKDNESKQENVVTDEELHNVTGGQSVQFATCDRYKTQDECFKHLACTWSSKKNLCYYELKKPKTDAE